MFLEQPNQINELAKGRIENRKKVIDETMTEISKYLNELAVGDRDSAEFVAKVKEVCSKITDGTLQVMQQRF